MLSTIALKILQMLKKNFESSKVEPKLQVENGMEGLLQFAAPKQNSNSSKNFSLNAQNEGSSFKSHSPKESEKSGPLSLESGSMKAESPKAASGLFAQPKISEDSVFGDGKIERIGQILQRLQSQDSEDSLNLEELIKLQREVSNKFESSDIPLPRFPGPMKKKRSKLASKESFIAFKKLDKQEQEEEKKSPSSKSVNFERCNELSKKIPKKFMSVLKSLKSNCLPHHSVANELKLFKFNQAFEELIKLTYKDPQKDQSEEQKKKSLDELNYNITILYLVREAMFIATVLYSRQTSPVMGPLPYAEAIEFSKMLEQAYNQQLSAIEINPFMEQKQTEVVVPSALNKKAKDIFPISPKNVRSLQKDAQDMFNQYLPKRNVKVAPNHLVVSICSQSVAVQTEKILDERPHNLRILNKPVAQAKVTNDESNLKCNILPFSSKITRQGVSQGSIIQQLIQLVRSLMATEQGQRIEKEDNSSQVCDQIVNLFNESIAVLGQKEWASLPTFQKEVIFGVLSIIGGWKPQIKAGALVQVKLNSGQCTATVVDEGYGKNKVSVILDDLDQKLQIIKVDRSKVRPIDQFQFPQHLFRKFDQQSICKAISFVFDQAQSTDKQVPALSLESPESENLAEYFSQEILSTHFLLQMLLKISSQFNWSSMSSQNDGEKTTLKEFLQLLLKVARSSNSQGAEEAKLTQSRIEQMLHESWENIVEKTEKKNQDFFAPREFRLDEEESKDDNTDDGLSMEQKTSSINKAIDQNFVNHQSSYLIGLPSAERNTEESKAILRMINYYEKMIIPPLVKYCSSNYGPHDWFGFGQIRAYLAQGNCKQALSDIMIAWENNPGAVPIPNINHDWSGMTIGECIVGQWCLASFKQSESLLAASSLVVEPPQQQQGAITVTHIGKEFLKAALNQIPKFNKLHQLGIDELLVQIKATDSRYNVVLAEYKDPENMLSHRMWIPVAALRNLDQPLAASGSDYSAKTLSDQFKHNTEQLVSVYARQTLQQLFQSLQKSRITSESVKDNEPIMKITNIVDLQLEELTKWSIWECFNEDPIEGWMSEMQPSVSFLDSQVREPEKADKPQIINTSEDQAPKLSEIFRKVQRQIEIEQAQPNASKGLNQEAQDVVSPLSILKQLFADTCSQISDDEQKRAASSDSKQFNGLVSWCVENWKVMAKEIESQRGTMNLLEEFKNMHSKQTKKSSKEIKQTELLPLHEFVPGKGLNATGTLLMFKKGGIKLGSFSKVQLFADQDMTQLLYEFDDKSTQAESALSPKLIPSSTIWMNYDAGNPDLNPFDDARRDFSCALMHFPKEYPVVCWLTEVLTTSLVQNSRKTAPKYVLSVFEQLITALQEFYMQSKAPKFIKSVIMKLMSRILKKMRAVYSCSRDKKAADYRVEEHLQLQFVSKDFVNKILEEVGTEMKNEELEHQQSGNKELQILYSAFVQDSSEFLMNFCIPCDRYAILESFKDLHSDMPQWLEGLVKFQYFMHYLKGEMKSLPTDMLKELHQSIQLNKEHLDNMIVIRRIPKETGHEDLSSKDWVRNRILELTKSHQARIVDPDQDIQFVDDDEEPDKFYQAVMILDSFNYKRNEVEPTQYPEGVTGIPGDDEEIQVQAAPVQEEEKEEEAPTVWACPICTFENSLQIRRCEICGSGEQPPMAEIIAAFRRQKAEESAAAGTQNQETKKPIDAAENLLDHDEQPHIQKLKLLSTDISRMISYEQRMRLLKQVKLNEEAEAKKAAEEAEAKLQTEENQDKKDLPVIEESKSEVKSDQDKNSEGLQSDDGNEDWQSDTSSVDYNNLPEDRHQRWEILGLDLSMINEDPGFLQVMEASALEEKVREQNDRKEARKQKQLEKENAENAKKKQEQEEAIAKLTKQGGEEITFFKLDVFVGQYEIEKDAKANRTLQDMLRDRLGKQDADQNVILSDTVMDILKQIHSNIHELESKYLNPLPQDDLCEDFGINFENLKETDLEGFVELMKMLTTADVRLFFKVLESQGYDLWLTKATKCSYLPPDIIQKSKSKQVISILEIVRQIVENEVCQESKLVEQLEPNQLRLLCLMNQQEKKNLNENAVNYYDDSQMQTDYPEVIQTLDQSDFRYMWALLKSFNKYLGPSMPFVSQNSGNSADSSLSNTLHLTISSYLAATRNLGLLCVKGDLKNLILEKTAVPMEGMERPPKLYFERMNLIQEEKKAQPDASLLNSNILQDDPTQTQKTSKKVSTKANTMFNRAFQQVSEMGDKGLSQFRPPKPRGETHIAFEIVFSNEKVEGSGGPYRQFFADISKELQPSKLEIGNMTEEKLLSLLVPSANNHAKEKFGGGFFVINPLKDGDQAKGSSAGDLAQYEFLGLIMGVCVRTGSNLMIDLPKVVWKRIVGQKFEIDDIFEVDLRFINKMKTVLDAQNDEDLVKNCISWSQTQSAGQGNPVDLTNDGTGERTVKFSEKFEYVEKALTLRLKESIPQCEAIRRGISKIVPESLLNTVTYGELETMVCGKKNIDVALLRRCTQYGGQGVNSGEKYNDQTPVVQMFWEFLQNLSQDYKQKFVKFCWGQERIPDTDEGFKDQVHRVLIKAAPKHPKYKQDDLLPRADACFFNFELPEYTDSKILSAKILKAVIMDNVGMNKDDNAHNSAVNAGRGPPPRHFNDDDDY